jgi:hypothetical protein
LDDELEVQLMENKGSKWPDALGCGAFPLWFVSNRFVDSWSKEGLGELSLKPVIISGEIPQRLATVPQLDYFCIDGSRTRGADLDAAASGYVDLHRCSACWGFLYDVKATRQKQQLESSPFAFNSASWHGANLFTTELTRDFYFFCTEEVVRLARNYKLTNLRFVATENQNQPGQEGIDYSNDQFVL